MTLDEGIGGKKGKRDKKVVSSINSIVDSPS